jgi:hypothetical protein
MTPAKLMHHLNQLFMKQTYLPFRRLRSIFLPFLLLFIFVIGQPSCKSTNTETPDCFSFSYAEVYAKWNSTLSQADSAKFTPNMGTQGLEVTAFTSNINGSRINGTNIPAIEGERCETTLPQNLTYNTCQIKFSTLRISDQSGLLQFDYIKLIPVTVRESGVDYIAFDVYVVTKGVSEQRGRADPCPPLCPTPFGPERQQQPQ